MPATPEEKRHKRFKKIPQDWRDSQLSKQEAALKEEVSKVAIQAVVLELAKLEDEDLIKLRDQVATASAVYRDGKKMNTLKIEFIIEILRGRGVDVPDVSAFLSSARKSVAKE